MDEAEARRLLALAADDSDRPSMPALWPKVQRARRAEKRRAAFTAACAAAGVIVVVGMVLSRRIRSRD